MSVLFTNYAHTTITVPVGPGVTTITVADSTAFPTIGGGGGWFYANLIPASTPDVRGEIVKVTAVNGNNWTVSRGIDGTVSLQFLPGDLVEHRLNAAALTDLAGGTSVSSLTSLDAALTVTPSSGPVSIVANDFVSAGPNHQHGLVPDPGVAAPIQLNYRFLREDGIWAVTLPFGPSGGVSHSGLVPDPGPVAGATRFIREDGSWAVPASNVAVPTGTGIAHIVNGAFVSPALPVNISAGEITGNLPVSRLDSGNLAQADTFWNGAGHWTRPSSEFEVVANFFVDPTGVQDATALIQAAIDQISSSGGGRLLFRPGRYKIQSLTLKANVVLQGLSRGPFDVNVNPGTTTQCAILECYSLVAPAITQGNGQFGSAVCDLMFFYPNQNSPTAASPVVYPATINIGANGSFGGKWLVEGCTFVNSYDAIRVNGPRNRIERCNIGAYHSCIEFLDCGDYTICSDIWMVPWHDYTGQAPSGFPATIDSWCTTNKICITIRRVDNLMARNWGCQGAFYAAVSFDENLTEAPAVYAGWGTIDTLDIDYSGAGTGNVYGLLVKSTNATAGGFNITNAKIGVGGASAQTSIYFAPGGLSFPFITLSDSHIRNVLPFGYWNAGTTSYRFIVRDVYNIDTPGTQVTTPAVPASTVAVENGQPMSIQVFINTGASTITDVSLNGVSTGGNRGAIVVPSRQTIAITYSGAAPTWKWFTV